MSEPKVLSQSHDVSLEEKEIINELEKNLQDWKAQKPTHAGYARYTRVSRALIQRLHRVSEQRLNEQYRNLHLNDFDGTKAVHIHVIGESGTCVCGKV